MSQPGDDPMVVGGGEFPGIPPVASSSHPVAPPAPPEPQVPAPALDPIAPSPIAPDPGEPSSPTPAPGPVTPTAPGFPAPIPDPVTPPAPTPEPVMPPAPVPPAPDFPAPGQPTPAPPAPTQPAPGFPAPTPEPVMPPAPVPEPQAPTPGFPAPTPEPGGPPAPPAPGFPAPEPVMPPAPVPPAPDFPAPGQPAPGFPAPTPEPVMPPAPTPEPVMPPAPVPPAPDFPAPGQPTPAPPAPTQPAPGFPAPTPDPVAPPAPTPEPVMPPAPVPPAPDFPAPGQPTPAPPAPTQPAPGFPAPTPEPVMPPAPGFPTDNPQTTTPAPAVTPPAPGFPAPAPDPTIPPAPGFPTPGSQTPAPPAPDMIQAPIQAPAPPAPESGGFKVQDVLVAVAAHEGSEGVEDLERNVALTDLRNAARQQREDNKRVKKNTRRKSAQPNFIRVATRFHAGRPLVVAFASPKGGVAKSTTAANYAAYVAKASELSGMGDKIRVLLVDGDVANGNMALRLAHTLTPNMLDMVNHMDELASQGQKMDNWQRDISPFVLAHPKLPNMDILAAPDNPEVITQLRQEDLDSMMRAWAQFYQVVVFDCGTQITEFTNCAWLNYSSQVYLMVEPELACLNSTSEYVKRARKGQLITPDVCRIICVRADMDIGELNTQQAVGDVFSFIPPNRQFYWPDFHRDAIEAGNSGELLTLDSAEYAEALTPVVRGSLEVYEQDFGL